MEKKEIHNFTLLSSRQVKELGAVFHQLEHTSGARLVWLERAEENKTFGIAFQTQPWDDTGVFHILEHSVLCGSDRYPLKEPFVELLKSSLNTFLNAMTFPDKTFYPVSSRNHQDFVNLMRVYMDAVFHPLIDRRPEIFCQEGWHYELDEEGVLTCKGVVFNEMKGVFASPDALMENELKRRLFPDTCYRYVSGGDPEHICELTYQEFVNTHKRLYHPSNAYLFLDGNLDLEEILAILDKEYLSGYQPTPAPEPVSFQKPVDAGEHEIEYELAGQESLEGRNRLCDGFVIGTFQDREVLTAMQVLADALCGDQQAPLKRVLLERGLARNVRMILRDGTIQPWLAIVVQDFSGEKTKEVSEAVYGELERLARDGLEHKRILSTLDNLEFQARQRDYDRTPQGLVFGMQVLESWLYGGDPLQNLEVGELFRTLRRKCEEGYFEELLKRLLLENHHRCRVLMRPSHTVGMKRRQEEAARLQTLQNGWSQQELQKVRHQQEQVQSWQQTPDSVQALNTIPRLTLEQISSVPEQLPVQQGDINGIPVLSHKRVTGGILYLRLYFAIDDLSPEQLSQAVFLGRLMGFLDTKFHGLEELQRMMRSLFGSLHFGVEAYGQEGDSSQCRSFFCVSCSMMEEKTEEAVEFLTELLTQSRMDDAGRVEALLGQMRTGMANQIVMSGSEFALGRLFGSFAVEGAVKEYTGGIAFYRWMKKLEETFAESYPPLAENLSKIGETIFTGSRLTVSVTGNKKDAAKTVTEFLKHRLPAGCFCPPKHPQVSLLERKREGIIIPADVSFSAAGGAFSDAGTGTAKVLARKVSLDYLWNAVRVQGGAYGTGMSLKGTGFSGFYSFRDPNPSRTLECFSKVSEFLEQMEDSELTGVILGAVAESDPLLTPRMCGETAVSRYWRGIFHETMCRVREEMLAADTEQLRAYAKRIEEMLREGAVCVLGPEKHLETCGSKLDVISVL